MEIEEAIVKELQSRDLVLRSLVKTRVYAIDTPHSWMCFYLSFKNDQITFSISFPYVVIAEFDIANPSFNIDKLHDMILNEIMK